MPRPRREKSSRKIEASRKGRVWCQPGEPHPLDKLDDELVNLHAQLPAEIDALLLTAQQTVQHLQAVQQLEQEDDPTEAFTAADSLADHVTIERFSNRKHAHHLRTIFALLRRKRLLGRLQAVRTALDLANRLLAEDETLTDEFLATWRENIKEQEKQEKEEQQPLTTEELRLQHLDEPLTPIVGSVEQSRRLLRDFEQKLPALRAGLAAGNGWFEIFYVPKRHYTTEVVAYGMAWVKHLAQDNPMPAAIEHALDPRVAALIQQGAERFPRELRDLRDQVYDISAYIGPYAKYRWRENGQTYTISLGLLSDYPPMPFTPAGF